MQCDFPGSSANQGLSLREKEGVLSPPGYLTQAFPSQLPQPRSVIEKGKGKRPEGH